MIFCFFRQSLNNKLQLCREDFYILCSSMCFEAVCHLNVACLLVEARSSRVHLEFISSLSRVHLEFISSSSRVHLEFISSSSRVNCIVIASLTRSPCSIYKIRFVSARDTIKMV